MNIEGISVSYESQGRNNYVCVQVEDEVSRYQETMLGSKKIPGLLSMNSVVLNGVNKLYYDITQKRRLSDLLVGREISGENAKQVLLAIAKALIETEEYFLSFTSCILDPDYIFVDAELNVGIICLPFSERTITDIASVQSFYNRILVEYLTEENDMFFISLLKFVCRSGFSLGGLIEQMEAGQKGGSAAQQRPVMPQTPAAQPVKPVQPAQPKPVMPQESQRPVMPFADVPKTPAKQETPAPKPEAPVAGGFGFSIPGMSNKSVPEPPKAEAEKEKAKKGSLFGSLFGGEKKKEEKKPEGVPQGMPIPGVPQPGGRPVTPPPVQNPHPVTPNMQQPVNLPKDSDGPKTQMFGMGGPTLFVRGKSVELLSFPFRIGNGKVQGVNLVVPSNTISRHHATICFNNEEYYIRDENSSNHTYVNGKQIPPYTEIKLNDGDTLRLANEEMKFSLM